MTLTPLKISKKMDEKVEELKSTLDHEGMRVVVTGYQLPTKYWEVLCKNSLFMDLVRSNIVREGETLEPNWGGIPVTCSTIDTIKFEWYRRGKRRYK